MNRYFASLVPAAALAMIFSVPAFAQPAATAPAAAAAVPASAKVGIVNIQAAIVGSNEGQRDFEELQKKFDPKRQELEGLNKEVDELQKKFNAQGDKLNDEARADLLKQIDSKKKQLQRNYEDANTDIQAQQNDIANRIGQKLVSVLDKYAKANGFTVDSGCLRPAEPGPVGGQLGGYHPVRRGGLQRRVGRSRSAQEGGRCGNQACGRLPRNKANREWNPRPPTRWAVFLRYGLLVLWKCWCKIVPKWIVNNRFLR